MRHNNGTTYMSMSSVMGYITPIIHKLLMIQHQHTKYYWVLLIKSPIKLNAEIQHFRRMPFHQMLLLNFCLGRKRHSQTVSWHGPRQLWKHCENLLEIPFHTYLVNVYILWKPLLWQPVSWQIFKHLKGRLSLWVCMISSACVSDSNF